MTRHSVYLEIAVDGRCMAHVPDLPGCFVCAPSRDEVLRQVPEAIRASLAWLRRHGESVPPGDDPAEIEVAGECAGTGPFGPGDTAALFAPDRQPIAPQEMARYFDLMAHARADLLALVRHLPAEVLDWRPVPDSFTVRQLLRHVGNAEEWYVSRIVPPETLPAEWEDDEHLAVFDFLAMERRTAIERLRQLTEDERARVFYPAHWTSHPDEAWTARKALRRFLEHEREHTAQVRDMLAAWRVRLLARLAAERAALLWQMVGLDRGTLAGTPILDNGWTAKDLLVHVAAWDELFTERVTLILDGREDEIAEVDLDGRNAALYVERRDWPLERALDAFVGARADFLATLTRLPEQEFHRQRQSPRPGSTVRQWAEWRASHDATHAADLAAWRDAHGIEIVTGCRDLLSAGLAAAREELLAATAMIPPVERATRPVCGKWAVKDVLAHVADWEWIGAQGLRHMAAGRSPQVEHIENLDDWNQLHYEARRDQPWEEVWADLHAARQALLEALEGMVQANLVQFFDFPWGTRGTAYQWLCVYVDHDRGHAHDVRDGYL